MRFHRTGLKVLVLPLLVACALAFVYAGATSAGEHVSQVAPRNSSDSQQLTFEGMVSCSRCGAKHSAALGQTAVSCVRTCVHGGASFTLVAPQATYRLDGDSLELKGVAGQRAEIKGTLEGQVIRVSAVVPET